MLDVTDVCTYLGAKYGGCFAAGTRLDAAFSAMRKCSTGSHMWTPNINSPLSSYGSPNSYRQSPVIRSKNVLASTRGGGTDAS